MTNQTTPSALMVTGRGVSYLHTIGPVDTYEWDEDDYAEQSVEERRRRRADLADWPEEFRALINAPSDEKETL